MNARVITTLNCNRNCENCCNKEEVFNLHKVVDSIDHFLSYDQILITGGEPMLIPSKIISFMQELSYRRYNGKIYLYSALYNRSLYNSYHIMMRYIDGLHFTVHYEAGDKEVSELKQLSDFVKDYQDKSLRLAIDSRLYDKYDFSNIDFSGWSVVRKLKWLLNCPLPKEEELFLFKL